ncbi:MAG TPA: hypothetical protein VGC13_11350 [Longimicrobium sp.]|jgi:hypothetical protein|uniref:hypothetical protein n=1 Tax=Longimicrobium sp. TaxID=2029185 RepID=UPI002EDAC03E
MPALPRSVFAWPPAPLLAAYARWRWHAILPELPEEIPVPGLDLLQRALGCSAGQARVFREDSSGCQRRVLALLRGRPGLARRLLRWPGGTLRPLPCVPDSGGASLLALPLTVDAVALVAALLDEGRTLRILQTPATETFLTPLLADLSRARARLATATELLGMARAGERAVYVTFPDHAAAGLNGRWETPFLGSPHLFSLLEPLLAARGVSPVYTLDVDGSSTLALRSEFMGDHGSTVTSVQITTLVEGLAGAMERVIRWRPEEVLSWGWLDRNSASAAVYTRTAALGYLRGFLRVWQASGPGMEPDLYAWSTARLNSLSDEAKHAPRALNAGRGA